MESFLLGVAIILGAVVLLGILSQFLVLLLWHGMKASQRSPRSIRR